MKPKEAVWRSWVLCLAVLAVISNALSQTASHSAAQEQEKVLARIFCVKSGGVGSGTGFFVDASGNLATNHHVVEGRTQAPIVAYLDGDRLVIREAEVRWESAGLDMAVLKLDNYDGDFGALGVYDLSEGNKVLALGYPGQSDDPEAVGALIEVFRRTINESIPLTELLRKALDAPSKWGNIELVKIDSRWPDQSEKLDIIDHDCTINHGNSGGPLVDTVGRIIGINTMINDDTQIIAMAGSIKQLIPHLDRLGIDYKLETTPPTMQAGPDGASGRLGGKHIALISVTALLAVLAIFLSMKRSAPVMETFSQAVRRAGSFSTLMKEVERGKEAKRPAGDIPSKPGPGPTPAPGAASGQYALEGAAPDGGRYRLDFTDNQLDQAGGRLTIGRKRDLVQLYLNHDTVSKQHAVISRRNTKSAHYLENRSTSSQTAVNGVAVGGEVAALKLKDGDRISLGEVELVFKKLA